MARYVCDFEQVYDAGNKLIDAATQIKSATSSYSSNIEGSLSGWDGQSKNSFSRQSSTQTGKAISKAEILDEFGEFVVNAARKIQELEDSLSGLSI